MSFIDQKTNANKKVCIFVNENCGENVFFHVCKKLHFSIFEFEWMILRAEQILFYGVKPEKPKGKSQIFKSFSDGFRYFEFEGVIKSAPTVNLKNWLTNRRPY
jgi:hypothetical protein